MKKKFIILLLCLHLFGCASFVASPEEDATVTVESALKYYETTKSDALWSYMHDQITLAQYNEIRALLCVYKSKHERALDEYMVDKNANDLDNSILKAVDELKVGVKNVRN